MAANKESYWKRNLWSIIQCVFAAYCAVLATLEYLHRPNAVNPAPAGVRVNPAYAMPSWLWIGLIGLCLSVAAPAIIRLVRNRKTQPSRLRIHNADYRATTGQGTPYDVTECLQKMIRGDSLVLNIQNENFQAKGHNYVPKDPFFGVMKRLDVTYSFDGVPARAIRPEGTRMVLPEDTFIASAVAGVPQIPFSIFQLKAFQLAKEIRLFLANFEPMPPSIDTRTQDEKTRMHLIDQRGKWRQKLKATYQLEFEDRKRKLLLEFAALGFPLDLSRTDLREVSDVIVWEANAIIAAAHRLDGASLSAGI